MVLYLRVTHQVTWYQVLLFIKKIFISHIFQIPSTSASTESAQNVDNGDLSIPVDNLFIDERRNYGNHSPTFYNGEKKAHDEDCYDGSDPQKDDTELDSVICSMKLLFMSKEVREAIKTNCSEEYTVLRQYFDFVP